MSPCSLNLRFPHYWNLRSRHMFFGHQGWVFCELSVCARCKKKQKFFFFFLNNSLPWLILQLARQLPCLVPLDKTEKRCKYCHVVVINHSKRTEGMRAEEAEWKKSLESRKQREERSRELGLWRS